MFTPAKLAVLLSAALSVAAMPSHVVRDSHHHREIAARVAQPEVAPVVQIVARDIPAPAKRLVRRKRDDSERCKEHDNGNAPSSLPKEDPKPTSTSSEEPAATPEVDLAQNLVNNPKEDPKPTTPTPTPTPTPSPSPTTSTGAGGETPTPNTGTGGETHTGQGTFYDIGLGACGVTNHEPDFIVAVSKIFFDQFTTDGNSNHNTLCGKTARVSFPGKQPINVIVNDRCDGCAEFDLDFSRAAFAALIGDESLGRVNGVTWQLLN